MSGLNDIKAGSFEEKDVEKLAELLNFLAKNAKLTVSMGEAIELTKLLSHAQQVILPKMKKNIMGEVKLHENVVAPKKASKKKATK